MQTIDINQLNPTDQSRGNAPLSRSAAEIFEVGASQPPVKPGRYVIYIKAPNKGWEQFLRYVARFHGRLGLTWDGLVSKAAAGYNASPSRPNGLNIRFLKSGEYTRIKETNGKVTTIPRKGFDETRRALYFVVEFK